MGDTADIASLATGLSSAQTGTQLAVGVLAKEMDTEKQFAAEILKLLGVGRNVDFTA